MGFFKELHKSENKLLGNDVIKYADPGAYYTNKDIQKRGPTTFLGGLWEKEYPKAPEQSVADESAFTTAKAKTRRDALKRQGAGVGSTLLTGGEGDVLLGSDGTLGNG